MIDKPEKNNDETPEKEPPYGVGYGKPPLAGRFKPGQSGNPKGRKKGARSAATIYRDVMDEKISIREGDKEKKLSRIEVIIRQTATKATKGDPKATAQALSTGRELGFIAPERIDADADAQKRLTAEDREILLRHLPDALFDMGE